MTVTRISNRIKRRLRRPAPAPVNARALHLAEAAQLITQIRALTEQLDTERAWLLMDMERNQDTRTSHQGWTVQVAERANWHYSDALEREKLFLKQREKREQAEGLAVNTPTRFVKISPAKATPEALK